ncbi:MAG: hypothetical protein LBI12_02795 [Treponema sp.]|jgi:hypothetical protein|nr:hypothetical protein [Treponema sp.]
MKKLIVITAVLSLFALSCGDGGGGRGGGSGPQRGGFSGSVAVTAGTKQIENFLAQDLSNDRGDFYTVTATHFASSPRCDVWVENGSGISEAIAIEIAREYSNNIYLKIMNNFGWRDNFSVNGLVMSFNTLSLANWRLDGSLEKEKLTILLLDIKGSSSGNSVVAGYFWAGNFLSKASEPNSNECAMIYMNVNPAVGRPATASFYGTLAHEMQHLLNSITSTVYRGGSSMDTWIDEGLSEVAEYIYSGKDTSDRIGYYKADPTGLIKQGNNFFVWDNRSDPKTGGDPDAALDDYATAYLFFRWLGLQAGNKIYFDIIVSNQNDYGAITNSLNAGVSGQGYNDWETVLRTWYAANYINSPSGPYGYRRKINGLTKHYAPTGIDRIKLYPGEGVFSLIETEPSLLIGPNIRYAGLNAATVPPQVNTSGGTYTGTLLTYNINTSLSYDADGNLVDTSEDGTVTGVAVKVLPQGSSFSMQYNASGFSGPFRISAGDMMRRRGFEKTQTGGNKFVFDDGFRAVLLPEKEND